MGTAPPRVPPRNDHCRARVNRLCGDCSFDLRQNVISQPPPVIVIIIIVVVVVASAACHLRRRRAHLPDHVLSARRQPASQHRTRGRRRPRSYPVDHPHEAAHRGPGSRARKRLPTACVQLRAVDGRLSAVAGGGRSHTEVCCRRTWSCTAHRLCST